MKNAFSYRRKIQQEKAQAAFSPAEMIGFSDPLAAETLRLADKICLEFDFKPNRLVRSNSPQRYYMQSYFKPSELNNSYFYILPQVSNLLESYGWFPHTLTNLRFYRGSPSNMYVLLRRFNNAKALSLHIIEYAPDASPRDTDLL